MILWSVVVAAELNVSRTFFYQDTRYRLVLRIPPSRDDKGGHSDNRGAGHAESPRRLLRFKPCSGLPLFVPPRTIGGTSEHERADDRPVAEQVTTSRKSSGARDRIDVIFDHRYAPRNVVERRLYENEGTRGYLTRLYSQKHGHGASRVCEHDRVARTERREGCNVRVHRSGEVKTRKTRTLVRD